MTFLEYFKSVLKVYLLENEKSYYYILLNACFYRLSFIKEKIYWVRDQFYISLCEGGYLAKHGDGRRLPQLKSETLDKYRVRLLRAYEFYERSGRRVGIKGAVKLITDKAFNIIFLNADGWKIGRSSIGRNNPLTGVETSFRFRIYFFEKLTNEEKENLDWILMKVKAARDIYDWFEPIEQKTRWKVGHSMIGINNYIN